MCDVRVFLETSFGSFGVSEISPILTCFHKIIPHKPYRRSWKFPKFWKLLENAISPYYMQCIYTTSTDRIGGGVFNSFKAFSVLILRLYLPKKKEENRWVFIGRVCYFFDCFLNFRHNVRRLLPCCVLCERVLLFLHKFIFGFSWCFKGTPHVCPYT